MKNTKNIEKWVEALRSGKYNQCQGGLQDSNGYCCLGVACDVFIPKKKQITYTTPSGVTTMAGGFPTDQENAPLWLKNINDKVDKVLGQGLSDLNDSEDMSFDEIADMIELIFIHKAFGDVK